MEATKDNISLETAKLLENCGIKSKKIIIVDYNSDPDYKYYPAFTWQEILWEHAKEFFGDIDSMKLSRIILQIIIYLQQKKYNEADECFRRNCVLTNK